MINKLQLVDEVDSTKAGSKTLNMPGHVRRLNVTEAVEKLADAQLHVDPPTFVGFLQPACTDSTLTRGVDHSLPLTAANLEKATSIDESEAFLRSIIEDDEATIFPSSSDESCGFRTGLQYDKMSTRDL